MKATIKTKITNFSAKLPDIKSISKDGSAFDGNQKGTNRV